jgi:hypothetical protein
MTSLTLGGCDLGWRFRIPRAQVLFPDLVMESGCRPPHVYGIYPYPDLCVFDPQAGEWQRDMIVAHTYVLWVARWLAAYELWLVTKKWTGPERHPDPARDAAPVSNSSARPIVITSAQVQRVALAEGMDASAPLLRANIERRSPSLLLDWI